MKILGVDPGSSRIGFGLIEKNGSELRFKKVGVIEIQEKDAGIKLMALADRFKKLITLTKPRIIAIEKLFFTKNIKTGIEVAQSRGIIMLLALKSGAAIMEFTPQQIKQGVTNYGGADKKAVARMVLLLLKIPRRKILDDATDALAIAITAANQYPKNTQGAG